MFVCKQVAKLTNGLPFLTMYQVSGKYDVVLDAGHLDLIMAQHTSPPPTAKQTECTAVRVAFPPHAAVPHKSFCLW